MWISFTIGTRNVYNTFGRLFLIYGVCISRLRRRGGGGEEEGRRRGGGGEEEGRGGSEAREKIEINF